jgi:hypothetical protein
MVVRRKTETVPVKFEMVTLLFVALKEQVKQGLEPELGKREAELGKREAELGSVPEGAGSDDIGIMYSMHRLVHPCHVPPAPS